MELIRLEGPAASDRFEIVESEAIIGRAPDCDVIVFDPQASRRHARLRRDGRDFVVEDLQEANPTIVNDHLLDGPHRLEDGDLIVVGGVVFLVEIERPTPSIDATSSVRAPVTTEPSTRRPAAPILPASSVKPSQAAHEAAKKLDGAARRLQSRASALSQGSTSATAVSTTALDVLLAAHERLGGDDELARLSGLLRDRLTNQTDIRALYRLGDETEALAKWIRLALNSMAATTKLAAALDLR